MKRLTKFILLLAFIAANALYAQPPNLVQMEYYFDDDPGFGLGQQVSFSFDTIIDVNFEADLSLVEAGFHKLFVRVKDENGKWSLVHRQDVYKADQPVIPDPLPDVVKMEYYFDDDPGFGMGVDVPINAATLIDENFEADLILVEAGFHKLFVRVKDENGKWSLVHRQDVYKADQPVIPEPLPGVVKMEYYFDDNPGFGMGTDVPIANGEMIDENFDADLSLVEAGFHKLFVRVKDETGKWSLVHKHDVYKADQPYIPESLPDLVKMEYFVDTDPGFGQGIQVDLIPDDIVSIDFSPEIFPLDSGHHVIRARVTNENGKWSLTHSHDLNVYLAANFKADKTIILENTEVQFTDLSSGDPTAWEWDFNNDGEPDSDEQNPSYTFTGLGSYTVTLTVFDSLNYDDKVKTEYIRVGLGHTIELQNGFQFVSSYMLPFNADFEFLMTDALDNISFARNSAGSQLEEFAGTWINGIGDWDNTEGYLVKMNADDQITIIGEKIEPQTPIDLGQGYGFISFLHDSPMNALYAFDGILDNLDFVRASDGSQIEQLFGFWINGIGDMAPGEGYLVKMNAADQLIYPEAVDGYIPQEKARPEHFVVSGGNPADIVWTIYVDPALAEQGDEIGVFDGDQLVGAGVIDSEDQLYKGIPVFGNLYAIGNEPAIRVWNKKADYETMLSGFSFTNPDGNAWTKQEFPGEDGLYSFVNTTLTGIENESFGSSVQIYPNPASDKVSIISECLAGAEIRITNQLGEICLLTHADAQKTTLDISHLNAGIYLIRISCQQQEYVKKLVVN